MKRRPRPQSVAFYIDADSIEDARWQAHHGVIEAQVAKDYPGATITYDLRTLRFNRSNVEISHDRERKI